MLVIVITVVAIMQQLYYISVGVVQAVLLLREYEDNKNLSPKIEFAETWSVENIGYAGNQRIRFIRDSVKNYVDIFLNAYLEANPK